MPYHHLTMEDRYVISHLKVAGFSVREIGRRLGRHHATISREIIRNGPEYPEDVYLSADRQAGTISLTPGQSRNVIKQGITAGRTRVNCLLTLLQRSDSTGRRKQLPPD